MASPVGPDESVLRQHESTRTRLLESALRVCAEQGIGDGALPRVLALAQVSPDNFRSQFASPDELWQAVADVLSNDLLLMIEGTAGSFVDPARRIGCGVRMYLREARDNPLFAHFVQSRGLDVAGGASLLHDQLPAHIATGTHTARFADVGLDCAIDLIAGTTLAAVVRIANGDVPRDHPEQVTLAILKALGVPAMQARRLVKIDLPSPHAPNGSMLAIARTLSKWEPRRVCGGRTTSAQTAEKWVSFRAPAVANSYGYWLVRITKRSSIFDSFGSKPSAAQTPSSARRGNALGRPLSGTGS